METKVCPRCRVKKELSFEFWGYDESRGKKFSTYCAECVNEISKDRRIEERLIVLKYYSNNKLDCACCGESKIIFLCLDHIYGNGNISRKTSGAGSPFYRKLIREGFPKGYQVLCFNCNTAKGQKERCPCRLDVGEVDLEYF